MTTTELLIVRTSRALLWLFPRSFREEFGHEITCDIADAAHGLSTEDRRMALAALWVCCVADLVRNLCVQWFRTGLPTLVVISVASSALLMSLLFLQSIPTTTPGFVTLHVVWAVLMIAIVLVSMLAGRYHGQRAVTTHRI
jgi:hypothetical protein